MKQKIIRNQYALTLVELLAALAISGVVVILVTNVFITSFKHQDISQSHLDLRQEANLVITELRNTHKKEEYNLCFNDHQLTINGRQLARKDIFFEQVTIEGTTTEEDYFQINKANQCQTVKPKVPLSVYFTLNDENDNPFELETVIQRYDNDNRVITVKAPADNGKGSFISFDRIEEFEQIVFPTQGYQEVDFRRNQCSYEGNTMSDQEIFAPNWGTSCPVSSVIRGSLLLEKDITVFSEIHTDQILYTEGDVTLENSGKIVSGENARMEEKVHLKSSSALNIGQNLYIEDHLRMDNEASITTGGSARFDGDIDLFSNTRLNIGHSLFAEESVTLQNNAQIIIGHNAEFEDLTMYSNSSIYVGGNFTAFSDVFIQSGQLTIEGNADFKGTFRTNSSNFKVCVKGRLLTAPRRPSQSSPYTIETKDSCLNQPNGTFYVLNHS
ncbi:PulJ/GspJ family protein [Jeotgalibacillus soli]|uniref:Prepilin-type N-terminal cleavage/methylation domain-containing protein n=1 Tax=Jeotgalibacillus soli TaxID=889306 RepID=A0A0C2V6D3_9BACL|nr:prepilin-type N-terminal cleavage/methylation domain-containing protein [Jeotgalibacillus soli]KIL44517.1 hypothetical protein KP78_34810 [Jeotgalibacillus soli]